MSIAPSATTVAVTTGVDWATDDRDSRRASPWATNLYDKAIARGCDHPHAVRILARAWAHIIWRSWQDNTAYNPAAHDALQTLLNQDQPAAA